MRARRITLLQRLIVREVNAGPIVTSRSSLATKLQRLIVREVNAGLQIGQDGCSV
jgi:hypothetical protein